MQEISNHQSKLNDQRKQMEKESSLRLDMEDKIMAHMQHQITHNRAAKYSERLTSSLVALKKERVRAVLGRSLCKCNRLQLQVKILHLIVS